MRSSFKKRIHKIGLPPGTLIPGSTQSPVKISVIDYDENNFIEKTDVNEDECIPFLNTPASTWIEVQGTSNVSMIQKIGTHFKLHPLLLEDIVSSEQRPKLDDYKDTLFIVLRRLTCDSESTLLSDEQISIVLGKNFVITFQENVSNFFEPIKARLRKDVSTMRKMGSDYLAYAIIDIIVDSSFIILEKIDQNFALLEDELINQPKKEVLYQIQRAKREIVLLRKSIWPTREVISQLRRIESPLVQTSTKFYMHDVYDHTIQAIDTIESLRDLTSSMLEIYLSNINQHLNEIMKFLTMISAVFCPLTFITGYYGMNFQYLPFLNSPFGPIVITILMIAMVYGMMLYFRKRGWLHKIH